MENRLSDHIQAIRQRLQEKWPNLADHLQRIEETGPKGWQDMLDECDLLFHEEKRNAIKHQRLHSDEIIKVEQAIERWSDTEKIQRFAIYGFLVWLKKQHETDNVVESTINEVTSKLAKSPPPTSRD